MHPSVGVGAMEELTACRETGARAHPVHTQIIMPFFQPRVALAPLTSASTKVSLVIRCSGYAELADAGKGQFDPTYQVQPASCIRGS